MTNNYLFIKTLVLRANNFFSAPADVPALSLNPSPPTALVFRPAPNLHRPILPQHPKIAAKENKFIPYPTKNAAKTAIKAEVYEFIVYGFCAATP